MRKITNLAIVCAAAALFVGCTNKISDKPDSSVFSEIKFSENKSSTSEIKESVSSTQTQTSSSESNSSSTDENFSFENVIPAIKDYFPDATLTVNGDPSCEYIASVEGFNDGECERYIEACKEKGFSSVDFDINENGGRHFEAYTEDKQFLIIVQLIDDGTPSLSICCYKE